jgi:hypothetical protein
MTRRGRLRAVILISLVSGASALLGAPSALADHCPPIDNPDPIPGSNTNYCHTPRPTQKPPATATPKATAKPAPTAAPATNPPVTRPSTPRPAAPVSTTDPEETPFEIEVPDGNDQIEVTVDEPISPGLDVVEPAGGASNWIFGFIVGFIVGGLAGRASWGLRRRRRQQIFG